MAPSQIGFLFLQLGTPRTFSLLSIFTFLHRFLNDRRVIDLPLWIRWPLVNLIIIPLRIFRIQKAYQSIWNPKGSPLSVSSEKFILGLQEKNPHIPIKLAYTYEHESITRALDHFQKENVSKIVVFPQFPQYAASSSSASIHAFFKVLSTRWDYPDLVIKRSFYKDKGFIYAICERIRSTEKWDKSDLFVFSFHGLPLRHLQKSGCAFAKQCQKTACPSTCNPHIERCYKAQCHQTAQAIIAALDIHTPYEVVFQSRLGSAEWINPDLEERKKHWIDQGIQSMTLVSPSFTVDCLETIEELGERFAHDWCANGRSLILIQSLNDSAFWQSVLSLWAENIHRNLHDFLEIKDSLVEQE